MHFSIITPTIGRDTLLRTCETIDRQTCADWEHLVIFDGPEQEVEVFKKIEHPQRKIIFSGNNFGDYGPSLTAGNQMSTFKPDDKENFIN